jgi:hypothetical protein
MVKPKLTIAAGLIYLCTGASAYVEMEMELATPEIGKASLPGKHL